jgi:hypothetical protein
MPHYRIRDGYCIAAADQDRFFSLFEFDENGNEVDAPDGPIAYVDRRYLRLLTPPSETAKEHTDVALSVIDNIVEADCGVG